ncbi:MAG: hypothetical protein WBG08_11410 [Litorimonas sp.]
MAVPNDVRNRAVWLLASLVGLAWLLFLLARLSGTPVRVGAEVLAVDPVNPGARSRQCELLLAYDAGPAVQIHAGQSSRPPAELVRPDWTVDRTRRRGDVRDRVRSKDLRDAPYLRVETVLGPDPSCNGLERGDRIVVSISAKPSFSIEDIH